MTAEDTPRAFRSIKGSAGGRGLRSLKPWAASFRAPPPGLLLLRTLQFFFLPFRGRSSLPSGGLGRALQLRGKGSGSPASGSAFSPVTLSRRGFPLWIITAT